MNRIIDAFRNGIRPNDRSNPIDWVQRNVCLPHSARSPKMDFTQTPWMIDPFLSCLDNANKEITICAPIGSSKTTLFEALTCYIVAEDSGGLLITLQTDEDAANWAEVRLHPVLKNCKPVADLFPKDRHAKRKTEIVFPHMPLFIGGAHLSHLQEKSIRWVLSDEVWIWKQGMVEEARRRTHDRWNSRVVLVSQGSFENDDFHSACKHGLKHVYHWHCDECGAWNPFDWGFLRWEQCKNEDGSTNWEKTFATVHMLCDCGAKYMDTPGNRRKLSSGGKYIIKDDGRALPRHKHYTYTALAVWWIPWADLVKEWIVANGAKRKGDIIPLRQFCQKRLAEFWTEEKILDKTPIATSGYVKADYADGALIPNEKKRLMAIDVQQDCFWYGIRAVDSEGNSKLLDEGACFTFEQVEALRQKYKVPTTCTFMDCAWEATENQVFEQIAKHRWIGLNGRDSTSYVHPDRRTGTQIEKLFSQVKQRQTNNGLAYHYTYAADSIKDILAHLRAGRGVSHELPDDVSESYKRQINSEVKKERFNKKTGKSEFGWCQVKRANHMWDVEVMLIAGAKIHGLI